MTRAGNHCNCIGFWLAELGNLDREGPGYLSAICVSGQFLSISASERLMSSNTLRSVVLSPSEVPFLLTSYLPLMPQSCNLERAPEPISAYSRRFFKPE